MNIIISTIFIALNGACVFLICYFLSKWMQRIESKLDSIIRKQSVINVHYLFWLKTVLEKDDQIEQAKRVEELINKEMEQA